MVAHEQSAPRLSLAQLTLQSATDYFQSGGRRLEPEGGSAGNAGNDLQTSRRHLEWDAVSELARETGAGRRLQVIKT